MSYQVTPLKNGLRVASESLPSMDSVAVAITVDVGARYETKAEGGISHLLEHMAFKGTKRRSARKIAEEFDDIGGQLNAYTSLEQTVYHCKVLSKDLPLALDMLADILQHSTFEEEELKREQGVILQEIAMHYDTPDDLIFDYFHEVIYPDQPLGRSILGTEKGVAGFTRADLQSYMAHHYRPSRMALTAAGDVDHADFVSRAETLFTLPAHPAAAKPEAATYEGGDIRIPRDLEQLHLMLGFKALSFHDEDYHASQLLAIILGGGMSSRLFQEVREKRGLAYTVQAFVTAYADSGILGIYAATGEEKAKELVPVLCGEMLGMTKKVSKAELRRAKNQQIASLLMTRESNGSVSEWIGRHLINYGEYRNATQMIAKIEAVTAADIARVARRILSAAKPALAALGPQGKLESYDRTCARFAA